jgi:hypothetical protein
MEESEKNEIDRQSKQKLDHLQQEYWRVRNGKQRFMRCPYCVRGTVMRRNFYGSPKFCCDTFAHALKAILDRQDEVNRAMQAAAFTTKVMGNGHIN